MTTTTNTPFRVYKKKGDNQFLYTDAQLSCHECEENRLNGGFYVEAYDRLLEPEKKFLCKSCYDAGRGVPRLHSLVRDSVLLTGIKPDGARLWLPTPPALVGTRVEDSVFSAGSKVLSDGVSERVDDQTLVSGREGYTLAGPGDVRVGLPESEVRNPADERVDIPLLLSAEPIIPEQLEHKKNENE